MTVKKIDGMAMPYQPGVARESVAVANTTKMHRTVAMITIMKANEMMPSWAIENCTPVVLAIMKVAAAVPGPQITRAAVPRNSAARRLEKVTSAMRSAHNSHRNGSHGPHLLLGAESA